MLFNSQGNKERLRFRKTANGRVNGTQVRSQFFSVDFKVHYLRGQRGIKNGKYLHLRRGGDGVGSTKSGIKIPVLKTLGVHL